MAMYDNEHWETLMRTIIERIGLSKVIDIIATITERDYCGLTVVEICPNTGLACLDGCDRVNCIGLHIPLNEWPTSGKEKGELSFIQQEAMKLKR